MVILPSRGGALLPLQPSHTKRRGQSGAVLFCIQFTSTRAPCRDIDRAPPFLDDYDRDFHLLVRVPRRITVTSIPSPRLRGEVVLSALSEAPASTLQHSFVFSILLSRPFAFAFAVATMLSFH